jgi:hypothetical protein
MDVASEVQVSVSIFQLVLLELKGTARRESNLYHSAQHMSLAGEVRITQVRRCLLCHAENFTTDFATRCYVTIAGSQHVVGQDNRYRPTRSKRRCHVFQTNFHALRYSAATFPPFEFSRNFI